MIFINIYKIILDALHFGALAPTPIPGMVVEVSPIRGLPADFPISIFFLTITFEHISSLRCSI